MRIGVDAHVLSGKHQGSRTYLANLVPALARVATPAEEIVLYGGRVPPTALDATAAAPLRVRKFHTPSALLRIPVEVPWIEYRDKLTVFHSQYICPPFSPAAEVITIHDLLFETNPEWFSKGFVARTRYLCRRSAKRAAVVLTVSHHSASVIREHYGVPWDRLGVTYPGADHVRPVAAEQAAAAWKRISTQYRVPLEFLLFVGRIDPRKNLVGLARALASLADHPRGLPPLVIVGQADHHATGILRAVGATLTPRHVILIGSLSDLDLQVLYTRARAVLHPSFAEGFGLPVLEAMASGALVLTALEGALREFAGDCVISWNPRDVKSMANAVAGILDDAFPEMDLRNRARSRAADFRWERTGQETMQWYRRTCA